MLAGKCLQQSSELVVMATSRCSYVAMSYTTTLSVFTANTPSPQLVQLLASAANFQSGLKVLLGQSLVPSVPV